MTVIENANTAFPEFNLDKTLPDLELTEISDDDSERREKYSTKEDQDVAVFMAIAQKLPIHSLVHLLQGHARAQTADYLSSLPAAARQVSADEPKGGPQKIKKFRFAEISGNQIRTVTHEIDSVKDIKTLWWNDEEMMDMRLNAIDAVKYFRRHRPDYTANVETVVTGTDKTIVENAMKQLTQDSFARGLEAHIVSLLSSSRRETVAAVLEEQKECKLCQDSYELTCESLRGMSLSYSESSRIFASKMAECDQIEALKAVLGKWEPESQMEM
jgi:hypothetical protein